MEFDHVGIVAAEKKPGAVFVAATRVWVTNKDEHPYRVEWLYFEPDSPVTGPLREGPHVAYRVQSVEAIREAGKGLQVVLEPFDAGFAVAGFYQTPDGAMIELVTYKDGPSPWSRPAT
jgi:catechol 2,3-dioxygenase-like lactoylglutathione lyase family enzyme